MSKVDSTARINGILLVNKPQGLTSNAVLQKVKRLFNAKKAGHTGSLDPLATGMLPICFGEATKVCQFLLDADKSYIATGLLGIKTSTGDAQGEIIAEADQITITESQLKTVLTQFTGSIQQIPPMYSALKHKGKPLYRLAREGVSIDRQAREVSIKNIELKQFSRNEFVIEVGCSKGTYIRSLVEDIGEALAVHAHVTRLHRTFTAGFETALMYSLDELENKDMDARLACLLPLESALNHFPTLALTAPEVLRLRQGKTIQTMTIKDPVPCLSLYDEINNFFGLGELGEDGVLKVRRLLAGPAA